MLVVEVKVVMVSKVGSPCRSVHIGGGLGVVIATTIDVIEDAAKVEFLSCVVGVGGLDVVRTSVLGAVPIVGHIHERRLCVVETEMFCVHKEHVERIGEHEVGCDGTLHEDA